jgi:predicted acyltransferase
MNGHLWSESKTWDPEGFLSTLPAIATLLIGILAGEWLRSERSTRDKIVGLAAAGIVLLAVGRRLHPFFPINKNLWTSTFVLFTGGFAMLALAVCYWLVDVRGWKSWAAPFLVFGMNAILAYALAALVSEISTDFDFTDSRGRDTTLHGWIYQRFFVHHFSPLNASLGFAIFFVLLIFAMLWPFDRAKLHLRI